MIAMFLMLLICIGIFVVIVSAFLRIIQFMFSLPVIGALAVILILMFIFFGI